MQNNAELRNFFNSIFYLKRIIFYLSIRYKYFLYFGLLLYFKVSLSIVYIIPCVHYLQCHYPLCLLSIVTVIHQVCYPLSLLSIRSVIHYVFLHYVVMHYDVIHYVIIHSVIASGKSTNDIQINLIDNSCCLFFVFFIYILFFHIHFILTHSITASIEIIFLS